MKVETYTCDRCGAVKGAANHWFTARRGSALLVLNPWIQVEVEATGSRHLCGERCVTAEVGEWMATQKETAHV